MIYLKNQVKVEKNQLRPNQFKEIKRNQRHQKIWKKSNDFIEIKRLQKNQSEYWCKIINFATDGIKLSKSLSPINTMVASLTWLSFSQKSQCIITFQKEY